jgi:hypothetical protein
MGTGGIAVTSLTPALEAGEMSKQIVWESKKV